MSWQCRLCDIKASPTNILPSAEDAEQSGSRQNGSGNRTKATTNVDAVAETACNELDPRETAIRTPAAADQASSVWKIDDEAEQDMTTISLHVATTGQTLPSLRQFLSVQCARRSCSD